MINILLESLWFLLPAGIANMAPVFAAKYNWLPVLARPIDGSAKLNGRRLLGDNKTWRGVFLGVIFGLITGYIQHLAFGNEWIQSISIVSYHSAGVALALGALLGFGALFGDAVKSFFKRQLAIAPGTAWTPFDQIDSVTGAFVIAWLFIPLSLLHVVVGIISIGIISYFINVVGVALKIKKEI